MPTMSACAEPLNGSCLCGAVAFTLTAPVLSMGHCHCSMCRHGHGTAFSTYCQLPAAALEVTRGAEAVAAYASSAGATREFCRHCGAKLFYRAHAQPDYVWVAAGALDGDPGVRPAFHIFVADKAPWYDICDDLPQYAGFPPDAGH